MTVTVYSSTDSSAPVLSGTVGSVLALLNACLVNGYGSKAAAGWGKPYTDSGNVGVIRQGAAGGVGRVYLRANDNAPDATANSGAQEARMTGYGAMTDINTGTDPFPDPAYSNPYILLRKSTTADATARAWKLVADHRTFYFFMKTGDSAASGGYFGFGFGDIYSYVPSDAWKAVIMGRHIPGNISTNAENLWTVIETCGFSQYGNCVVRWADASAGYSTFAKTTDWAHSVGTHPADGTMQAPGLIATTYAIPYPTGYNSDLYMAPVYHTDYHVLRGKLRGIWAPCHSAANTAFNDGDTFSGTGAYAGRTFMVVKPLWGNSTQGMAFVETSSTWDTSS
jgi:hypothetical protein